MRVFGIDTILSAITYDGVRAAGDGEGLSMRLGRECRRTDVGHPDLHRTQPLLPQALPVGLHLVS